MVRPLQTGTFLTNDWESGNLEVQAMPGLVPEVARLRQELAEAGKEAKEESAKLVSLGQIVGKL